MNLEKTVRVFKQLESLVTWIGLFAWGEQIRAYALTIQETNLSHTNRLIQDGVSQLIPVGVTLVDQILRGVS